ncbi:MAG: leucine-rich repeat protein, partial [Lachnospiraceae bacterium]|nr:leucine-rich repeat protein [Lachnospiraceae bacterium]
GYKWSPDPTKLNITKDQDFKLTETDSGMSFEEPDTDEVGEELTDPGGDTQEPVNSDEEAATPTESDISENNNDNENGQSEDGSLPVDLVIEEHVIENADEEGPEISEVFEEQSDILPESEDNEAGDILFDDEYKPDPTEVIYVCDEYAPIANICNDAFNGNAENVNVVDFPSNISKIGNNAFMGASALTSITLGSGLSSVGASAFQDCSSLTTVNFGETMTNMTIGPKAFANSGVSSMSNDGSPGINIPYSVKTIGNAAFYGTNAASVSFSKTINCNVGNYVFAKCLSLGYADLDYHDHSNLSIANLDSAEGMFAQCDILTEANMPSMFNGQIKYGFFGLCPALSYVYFNSTGGYFYDGEFDRTKITVVGPKPSTLDPTSASTSASYKASIKSPENDYVYRYIDNGKRHEIANELGYTPDSSKDFFKEKDQFGSSSKFIFDVAEPETENATLVAYWDRDPAAKADLEIEDTIGARTDNDGPIPIKNIAEGVFKGNSSIEYLLLNKNLDNVYNEAFMNSSIVKLWANVDGTAFHQSAFENNASLVRATFAYGGENSSSIGSRCFAETPKLDHVDFYDDNLKSGDKTKYARFESGTIDSDAFYTAERHDDPTTPDDDFVMKGPMVEGYAPYEFAIDSASHLADDQIYPRYYSGNPWNLTAQYRVQPFTRTYIDYTDTYSDTVIDPPKDYKKTKEFKKTDSDFETGAGGVCLLKYPNRTSYMDVDEIDSPGTVTVKDLESLSSPTRMELDCIDCAQNVVVPYGIDYIDLLQTKRTDYTAGDYYYIFIDDESDANYYLYREDGGAYYEQFKYNPDLLSVTFEDGSVTDFPDRMFEGAANLSSVTFNCDVKNLGYLPFYMPDTEAYVPTYSTYLPFKYSRNGSGNDLSDENRSHLKSIFFDPEKEGSSGSADNGAYSVTNGIIKCNTGEDVIVVQIAPSRGDPVDKSQPNGAKFFNSDVITADELEGVTKYSPYAAKDCDQLTSVSFNKFNDKKGYPISYGCFEDCDRLESVNMPNQPVSIGDKAFANISANMNVYFPNSEAAFHKTPFSPASKDGLTFPKVKFWVNEDSFDEPEHADKHANITYDYNEQSFEIIFSDPNSDDGVYTRKFDAKKDEMADTYLKKLELADDLPKQNGIKPTSWTGVDEDGNKVLTTDPLSRKTTFTPVYGSGDIIEIVFRPEFDGELASDQYKILLQWTSGDKFYSNQQETVNGVGIPTSRKYNGVSYTLNALSNAPYGKSITKELGYEIIIIYESASPTTTPTPTPTTTPTPTPKPTSSPGKTDSTNKTSSSSSNKSSSSSSSTAYPVYVNSQDAGAGGSGALAGIGSTVYLDNGSGSGGSGGSGSGGNKGSGNTTVISTTGGISDPSKITASVNGSSDNYVIKITQTQEADEMGLAALHSAYGDDISPIRYLPFDISLYDSTGTNKISPVPEGISVSLTMPIPDDLAIYGGNAKIASTVGGQLDKIQPRFTVINGVPCMTFTCTHLSPYMIYVDTANLTEAGIADATPKTADGIHPKWFLCFGLAAIAIVMFLKKDPEEYIKKAAA